MIFDLDFVQDFFSIENYLILNELVLRKKQKLNNGLNSEY